MTDFEFKLLNLYIAKVNSILKQITEDIPDNRLQQINQSMGKVADVWTRCLLEKANLSEFKEALAEWHSLQGEAVNLCLPKRINSDLVDAYIKAVNEVIRTHLKDTPSNYQKQLEEKEKCLETAINDCLNGQVDSNNFTSTLEEWKALAAPKPRKQRRTSPTDKQIKFVDEFMKCLNGAEAARRAGYSKKAAREIAYENRKKPWIKAEIDRRLEEYSKEIDERIERRNQESLRRYHKRRFKSFGF